MNKKKSSAKPDTDSITAREAAKILKVHPGTLGNWRCIGVGPAWSKFGDGPRGNVRYSRADVQAFAKKMNRKVSRACDSRSSTSPQTAGRARAAGARRRGSRRADTSRDLES